MLQVLREHAFGMLWVLTLVRTMLWMACATACSNSCQYPATSHSHWTGVGQHSTGHNQLDVNEMCRTAWGKWCSHQILTFLIHEKIFVLCTCGWTWLLKGMGDNAVIGLIHVTPRTHLWLFKRLNTSLCALRLTLCPSFLGQSLSATNVLRVAPAEIVPT